MRTRVVASLAAVVLAFSALGAEEIKAPRLADLAWMAGSWVTTDGATTIEEYWSKPSENAMLGMGRTLRGGKTVFYEYLRIEARADGIFYVAHPKARAGTDFKLTALVGRQATFENPEHDYPKRIVYRLEADGSLTARTDAGGAEAAKAAESADAAAPKDAPQEFKYRRLVD